MKILCVLLPHFPLRYEIRRHPELAARPAIVTYTEGSQKLVLDYSPELEDLQRNMPLQQALARHGEAELIQADIPVTGLPLTIFWTLWKKKVRWWKDLTSARLTWVWMECS